MPEVTIFTENGEKKSFHVPEITAIVGCSCCGHIFRDKDTKMTLVHSTQTRKFIKEWNEKYISPTEYLTWDEDRGMIKVTVNETEIHDLNGDVIDIVTNNPEPKYKYRPVDLKRVEYTCLDCLSKPVYISVIDQSTAPSNLLALADEIRTLREEHGARLIMLGHGRKIDTAVEMICCQLSVKFQEASE